MVQDTPPSRDASTHPHTEFAIKDMIILKTRSEVKVRVMRKWYVTLRHSYLREYRKYAPDTMHFLDTRSKVKVTVTLGWCATLRHFVIPRCIHISNLGFLPKIIIYNIYALDTIILKPRPEVKVKVTVTRKSYTTLYHPKMHPHTQFVIPISNNIRDMLPIH